MAQGTWNTNGSALKQDASAKLTALAAIGSTTGAIINTGASTAEIRAIGVGAGTSLPTVTDADTRYLRWFTSLPGTGVGTNGDYGVLYASGYPAVLILKTAGTWAVVSAAVTFAQMLAISSPVTGMTVTVSSIALGGTAGTITVNAVFSYDGTYWRPRYPLRLWGGAGANTVTNSATTFQAALSMVPPALLFTPGSELKMDLYASPSVAGTAGYSPQVHADSTLLCTSNAFMGTGTAFTAFRGSPWLWCNTVNILSSGAAATGMDDFTTTITSPSPTVMANPFNGVRTLQIGNTFDGTGTNKTSTFDRISITLVP
jgi:hypothetical protein